MRDRPGLRGVGLTTVLFLGFFLLLTSVAPLLAQTPPDFYYRAQLHSSVNPVTADFLDRVIGRAEADNAAGIVIQLDTPGGLMQSMKRMTDRIVNAQVPVIVWIGPGNAHAASAGVFITYASHVAVISSGSSLGAAHPVGGQGGQLNETMEEKVVNVAVGDLKGLARERDRSETLAERFVRESIVLNGREAVRENVVDFLADDSRELLEGLEGRTVQLANGEKRTLSGQLKLRDIKQSWKEEFLDTLVNPNLVYILLILGIYGLIYEFSNPGVGLGAVVGGVCLLLALYGLSILPVNYAGLGLILLGLGLMVLDVFVPSFGVLTLGGIVSFVLGSIFLFETEAFAVSWALIGGMAVGSALLMIMVGFFFLSSVRKPSVMGDQSFAGRVGEVREDLDPEGMIHVRGEYWKARSADESTPRRGSRVRVVEKRGRFMVVEPAEGEAIPGVANETDEPEASDALDESNDPTGRFDEP